jgi:hypothetical protein
MKLTPWLIESIEEKISREEVTPERQKAASELLDIRVLLFHEIKSDGNKIQTGRFRDLAMARVRKVIQIPGMADVLGIDGYELVHEIPRLWSSAEINAHENPKDWAAEISRSIDYKVLKCVDLLLGRAEKGSEPAVAGPPLPDPLLPISRASDELREILDARGMLRLLQEGDRDFKPDVRYAQYRDQRIEVPLDVASTMRPGTMCYWGQFVAVVTEVRIDVRATITVKYHVRASN